MKFLRNILDKQAPHFHTGGKLHAFYPMFEMADTFIYSVNDKTKAPSYIRDSLDLKRTMIMVAFALTPCILMAFYNTGLQANLALGSIGGSAEGWRASLMSLLGIGHNAQSIVSNFIYGGLFFLPIFLVTNIVGGFWEVLFAATRKHEINEGFLVTGLLFPLILPPTIPLWQVAMGISFGVVFGKEVFGGTGKNFLNPALTARVFLFFAYPGEITGESIWVAADGFTAATPLGQAAINGAQAITVSWRDAFLGFMPGSMGETSALACLIGALILIASGIGSWRIMLGSLVGMLSLSCLLFYVGSESNPMFSVPPLYHMVLGSFAFATVFMATDPVSATITLKGKYIYGFLIGILGIIIRSLNPAYPEGWMLAILLANCFAPVIDFFVISSNTKRRHRRYAN